MIVSFVNRLLAIHRILFRLGLLVASWLLLFVRAISMGFIETFLCFSQLDRDFIEVIITISVEGYFSTGVRLYSIRLELLVEIYLQKQF